MENKHKHKAIATTQKLQCWHNCVAAIDCGSDQRAHGNVVFVDTCECGAIKLTESNAGLTRCSKWISKEDNDESQDPRGRETGRVRPDPATVSSVASLLEPLRQLRPPVAITGTDEDYVYLLLAGKPKQITWAELRFAADADNGPISDWYRIVLTSAGW